MPNATCQPPSRRPPTSRDRRSTGLQRTAPEPHETAHGHRNADDLGLPMTIQHRERPRRADGRQDARFLAPVPGDGTDRALATRVERPAHSKPEIVPRVVQTDTGKGVNRIL